MPTAALLCLLTLAAPPDYGYPGRFATLRQAAAQPYATNPTFTLYVEKVLKVQAIVPVRQGPVFGRRDYAGSLTLTAPDGQASYLLPEPARRTVMAWPEPRLARVTQTFTQGDWRGSAAADLAVDYPAVWFTLRRESGAAPLGASLLGWGWAGRRAPKPERLSPNLVRLADEAGYTGWLRFDPAPATVSGDDDGVTWTFAPAVAGAVVTYEVLPGAGAEFIDPGERCPKGLRQGFGCDDGKPWVGFAVDRGPLALPPSLPEGHGAVVHSVWGAQRLVPGEVDRLALPVSPRLDRLAPEFKPLEPAAAARCAAIVDSLLAHQAPDGSFPFNGGRAFYEGLTLAALEEVAPLLDRPRAAQVQAAVARGLRRLWNGQQPVRDWPGVRVMPEQPQFLTCATDYPEILGCVLQATALYAAQADASYAKAHWDEIAAQFEQLRPFMDPSGVALAMPGPDYWHVIAESAIGGYLAWHGLAHLARLAGQSGAEAEARARAAYAWQAWRTLFAWRPEFGQPAAVVNGYHDGLVETSLDPAWTYVQSTFFSFLGSFELPVEDRFGLWRSLAAQPWEEWSGKLGSAQRVYDDANAIALTRAGRRAEVLGLWPQIAARPFTWQSFDETPVFEAAAIGWLGVGS